jgi:hypothetical protein
MGLYVPPDVDLPDAPMWMILSLASVMGPRDCQADSSHRRNTTT